MAERAPKDGIIIPKTVDEFYGKGLDIKAIPVSDGKTDGYSTYTFVDSSFFTYDFSASTLATPTLTKKDLQTALATLKNAAKPSVYVYESPYLPVNWGTLASSIGMDMKKKNFSKVKVPEYTARTQKARGVDALRKAYTWQIPNYVVYDLATAKKKTTDFIGKFVRPCPMRPRHGFVDSRLVTNIAQARRMIAETEMQDPDAEFIVMQKIDAKYSGIWTPGVLTLGRGNDGATAGTSAKTVPVIGTALGLDHQSLCGAAGVGHSPYLELLWGKPGKYENPPIAVQLRDGPKLPELATDYIPKKTPIAAVILADGDLLAWETKMKETPRNKGHVVWHPRGSLASHYAIHAILNKIPVVISHEPKVGGFLKPTGIEDKPCDLTKLRAGAYLGMTLDLNQSEAAYMMLAGCHHTGIWKGRHDVLLGMAVGCAWRLTLIAALGEFRHHTNATYLEDGKTRNDETSKSSRDKVYDEYWKKAHKVLPRKEFRKALHSFARTKWVSGYGGESWFRFSQWAMQMHNFLVLGDTDSTLAALNSLVHSAHNNGWGFDKFITESELDKTARNPVYATLRCTHAIYSAMCYEKYNLAAKMFMRYRKPIEPIEHTVDLTPTLQAKKAKKSAPTTDINYAQAKPSADFTSIEIEYNIKGDTTVHTKTIPTEEHCECLLRSAYESAVHVGSMHNVPKREYTPLVFDGNGWDLQGRTGSYYLTFKHIDKKLKKPKPIPNGFGITAAKAKLSIEDMTYDILYTVEGDAEVHHNVCRIKRHHEAKAVAAYKKAVKDDQNYAELTYYGYGDWWKVVSRARKAYYVHIITKTITKAAS